MTRFHTVLMTAVFLVFVSFVPVHAADVAKVGMVDFQRILDNSNPGKSAQAEINSQGKKMESELKERQTELEEMKKRLEREALVMNREAREDKQREFRIKANDLREMEKRYRAEIAGLNNRLVARLQKMLLETVEEIGKKEGYLLILEKREAGTIYAPTSIDMTDRVIQEINARYAKENQKNGKKK